MSLLRPTSQTEREERSAAVLILVITPVASCFAWASVLLAERVCQCLL